MECLNERYISLYLQMKPSGAYKFVDEYYPNFRTNLDAIGISLIVNRNGNYKTYGFTPFS